MPNTVIGNRCSHCGAEFLSGCVVSFICRDCEVAGHNPNSPFEECMVCYRKLKDQERERNGRAYHDLKVWPLYFSAIIEGLKLFEVRKNDRGFRVGDTLILKEWNEEDKVWTGRWAQKEIRYILHGGQFGIEEGYCVLGF